MNNTAVPAVVVLPYWHAINYGNMQGNVATGSTLTVSVPVGPTYAAIWLQCLNGSGAEITVAAMKSEISNVKLLVDSENVFDTTATQLLAIQQYDRQTNRNGILPIITGTPQMRDVASLNALLMGTADRKAAQIQITLGTVSTLSSVVFWANVIPTPRPMGAHLRVIRNPQTFGGTGFVEISTLPRFPGGLLLDLHADNAANVTLMRTRLNGVVTRNNVPLSVNNAELDAAGFTTQTGVVTQSFNQYRFGANGLPLDSLNDFAVAYSFSAAPTTFELIMRYLHNFGAANFA